MTADWSLRRLTPADLPACQALAADRDWPPDDRKWPMMFDVGEVFGIDAPDGGLAATGTLTRYGGELAAIGMLLTAERFGRRGLGRRLMEHLLATAGGATVFLYATTQGRPLYERIGFRVAGAVTTFVGEFQADATEELPAATSVGALDLAAYGADRAPALRWLAGNADRFLATDNAYGAAWSNVDTLVVGPVVAPDVRTAASLVAALTERWRGPVRIDVDHRHPWLCDWVGAHGPEAVNEAPLMIHNGQWPGERDRIFAPMNQALG
ncbi:GNAT family N-acetyltransferase [Fodinicola acaciae]|uniref:GNAT family N-acetyltransferase n=1 Tax=Fodinicola acaciae TaxID=2681555 RepID=UPI0013D276BF|nr:GNAT family N-acetyltransferase [Fodinicola acaciae]